MKKSLNSMKSLFKTLGIVFTGFVVLQSCKSDPNSPGYEFMPDMYRSPSFETYGENDVYGDTMMVARMPVTNTISRGEDNLPYAYPNTFEGYEAAGANLKNPLAKNDLNMAKGKELYRRMCSHCHGKKGKGDGPVPTNSDYPNPPAYDGGLKDLPEGKMFHSITYGKNLMGSHASQLNKTERWQIIMYVQTLQGKKAAPAADTTAVAMADDKKVEDK
jgi:mono/diheme cytochrome c family protein